MPTGTKPAPGPLTRAIGAILRGQMTRLDISHSRLAESISVSRSQLYKVLRGRAHVDIEQLHAMCTVLQLDAPTVLRDAENDAYGQVVRSTAADASLSAETALRFDQAMKRAGVTKIAARGELTPEALSAIVAIVSSRVEDN